MTRPRVRRGMTLLEVMVALTIAGSALASGAAVLGFLTDQQARAGSQSLVRANAVRGTLRHWMSESRLATEGDAEFRGRAAAEHSGSDELSFVTTAATDASESGTIVRLYVARGDSASGRGLMAELRPWRAGPRTATPTVMSLAPDASAIRVRYLASLSGRPHWTDNWVTTSVLPAALELRVELDSTHANGTDRAARALLGAPITIVLAARQ